MRIISPLIVLCLAACGQHHATIDRGAVSTMTAERWPSMYAALGPAAFKRANDKMSAVAEHVASDPACEHIGYVGVSQSGSTSDRIEWFVDCGPDYRVRLSEFDLN